MAVSANATLCNTASTLYANDGTSRIPEIDMILYTVSLTLSDPASKESKKLRRSHVPKLFRSLSQTCGIAANRQDCVPILSACIRQTLSNSRL